jgi:hypothetical protein
MAKACAAAMPATAMIDPMDRSISPRRITQVMPKAAMAITATCCTHVHEVVDRQ